jgi:hypothetical protein
MTIPVQFASTSFTPNIRHVQTPEKICKIARLSFLILPMVLWALLVGCKPATELQLPLAADEGFKAGSEVRLNGKVVGKVVETVQEGEQRLAILKITDRSALLPEGLERERPWSLNLSTRFCASNATQLQSGAVIATRTPVENITKPAGQFLDHATGWIQDHPLEICVGVVGFLLVICLIRGVFRRIGLALIVLGLALSTASGATGVVYSRSYFVEQQAQVATTLKDAEALLARANRLVEAGVTNEAGEAIVAASLLLDSVEIMLTGYPEKVAQLKAAPLSYARAEEQKRLNTNYSALQDNHHLLDEQATVLRRKDVGQIGLVREYIHSRELSRAKIKDGVTTDILLAELKAAAASSPRRDQAVVIVVTNTVVEKVLPTQVLPPMTNWVTKTRTNLLERTVTNIVTATNTVIVTNVQTVTITNMVHLTNDLSVAAAFIDGGVTTPEPSGVHADVGRTNEEKSREGKIDRAENSLPEPGAEVLDEPPLASKALTKGSASAATSAVGSRRPGYLLAWPLIGVGATMALSMLIAAMWLVGRARQPWVAAIHDCARGRRLEIALDNPDEVVAFRGDTEPQALSRHVLDEGTARIIRNWRGRAVLVSDASAKVSINGRPASAKVLLAEGDHISLAGVSGERIYKFEGAEFLDNQADAALPESTT